MAEQQQREIKWATDREAKRTREELNEHAVEIRSLKEQLQAKNRECDLLKNQLEDVGKTNAVALENRRNEDLTKGNFGEKGELRRDSAPMKAVISSSSVTFASPRTAWMAFLAALIIISWAPPK